MHAAPVAATAAACAAAAMSAVAFATATAEAAGSTGQVHQPSSTARAAADDAAAGVRHCRLELHHTGILPLATVYQAADSAANQSCIAPGCFPHHVQLQVCAQAGSRVSAELILHQTCGPT